MHYKVIFKHWIDDSQEAFDSIPLEKLKKEKERLEVFIVNEKTEENALEYAKRFEGLETNAYEGLGSIVSITLATQEEIKSIQQLSIYEMYLKKTI